MSKTVAWFGFVLVTLAVATLAVSAEWPFQQRLGFGVEILPYEDLDDFYGCTFTVFELQTDEVIVSRTVTTTSDDGNSMFFQDRDGAEIQFDCAIDADGSTATYEIHGTLNSRQVVSHVATVRLERTAASAR